MCCIIYELAFLSENIQTDQKKEAAVAVQEESDLEKKRREAEALLQSMGLTTDSPIGKDLTLSIYERQAYVLLSADMSELSALV